MSKQLESFIQNTSNAIEIVDLNGNVRRVNQAFLAMFGWSEDELLGKPLPIIPEHLQEETRALLAKVTSGEVIADYETVSQHRDGSLVDVSLTLSPIKDSSGQVIAVVGVLRNISQRKQAEAALKESEERYRQLVEMSPDIIWVQDHGEVLFMNQAGLDFVGIRDLHTNFGSCSVCSVLDPGQLEETMARERMLLKGEKMPPVERKIMRSNGEVNYYEVISATVLLKGKRVIQFIARDITERKRNEEALRKIHEQYRLIAENMSDLIAVFDVNGDVKYTSPSHETVLGYPAAYFEQHSAFALIHPDDMTNVQSVFAEIIRSKSPRQVEFRYKHKDGHWVYVEAKGTPIFAENGEIDRIVTVSRDVTERKNAEEKFRQSRALAAVGELAAGIAHEIRNPIASIKGFVQMIKNNITKPEYFDIMFAEFKNLEAKIDELLLLAKPQVVEYVPTDLWDLVQDVLMLLESQAILSNVQILTEPEKDLPKIRGDHHQLKQVFVNLLKNAIEAMPEGGEILVQTKKIDGERVSVTTIDQGCGISQERLKRIGEPFYSTKEKGTGLGLTISHKIVKEHGGTIIYRSEENKGTTVEVILPCLKSLPTIRT